MKDFVITYYRNAKRVSCENTIATNRFTAELYANEACCKMNLIDSGCWTFTCYELSAY